MMSTAENITEMKTAGVVAARTTSPRSETRNATTGFSG
jgi:hypothetical protein